MPPILIPVVASGNLHHKTEPVMTEKKRTTVTTIETHDVWIIRKPEPQLPARGERSCGSARNELNYPQRLRRALLDVMCPNAVRRLTLLYQQKVLTEEMRIMYQWTSSLSSKFSMIGSCGDAVTRIVFKLAVALAFALTIVGATEPSVLAAPPANDLRSAARLVTVGFSELLDTSEATTDADDAFLNSVSCNFPATDASVWYQFVGTGETFRIEVFRSDYSASVLIADRYSLFGCGIGGMDFPTIPGHSYYMMVLDDQRDGGGNGGMLNISISLAPPPPDLTVTLSVDRFGTVDVHTGVVTISGTYSCVNADSLTVNLVAWEELGRFLAIGFATVQEQATCDGSLHPWSADIYPDPAGRKFLGGRAMTLSSASSSGPYGGGESAFIEQEVILRGKN